MPARGTEMLRATLQPVCGLLLGFPFGPARGLRVERRGQSRSQFLEEDGKEDVGAGRASREKDPVIGRWSSINPVRGPRLPFHESKSFCRPQARFDQVPRPQLQHRVGAQLSAVSGCHSRLSGYRWRSSGRTSMQYHALVRRGVTVDAAERGQAAVISGIKRPGRLSVAVLGRGSSLRSSSAPGVTSSHPSATNLEQRREGCRPRQGSRSPRCRLAGPAQSPGQVAGDRPEISAAAVQQHADDPVETRASALRGRPAGSERRRAVPEGR